MRYAKPTFQGREVSYIHIIHRCMQAGTYRYVTCDVSTHIRHVMSPLAGSKIPRISSKKPWRSCANTTTLSTGSRTKKKDDVDDNPVYKAFKVALETSMRRIAKSGSRLFKLKDIHTKKAWMKTDVWRKHRCLLYLIRYHICVCPHEQVLVSS